MNNTTLLTAWLVIYTWQTVLICAAQRRAAHELLADMAQRPAPCQVGSIFRQRFDWCGTLPRKIRRPYAGLGA